MPKLRIVPDYEWSFLHDGPIPAAQAIPAWFQSMPLVTEGTQAGLEPTSFRVNTTVKRCVPFLDALSAGYLYVLQSDLEVTQPSEGELFFKWRSEGAYVEGHDMRQLPTMPTSGIGGVWKWIVGHSVRVPDGYSVLFTHPLNRHDLPFRTFSGVVDSDSYGQAVHFPFEWFATVGERLVLPQGTPLAQVIPFRREPWEREQAAYDGDESRRRWFQLHRKIVASYRTQHWTKKRYI